MPKKVLGADFTEAELRAREAASLAHMRAKQKPFEIRQEALKPYAGLTRHKLAQLVARERMRAEAEEKRGNTPRAIEARRSYNSAQYALRCRDIQAGSK